MSVPIGLAFSNGGEKGFDLFSRLGIEVPEPEVHCMKGISSAEFN